MNRIAASIPETEWRQSSRKKWLLALMLACPAFLPLVAHYIGFSRIGFFPTGFIQYDVPYYLANARELTDSGRFNLLYGNPFSADYATPRIYFQPLTLVIAILERITHADPGILFAVTGVVAAVVCIRVAIALFDRFAPQNVGGYTPSIVVFVWGGGLLTAAGLLFSYLQGQQSQGIFYLDPVRGWWFMNLGRNLVYPTEALYHAIFFAAILLILKQRFGAAVAALALMSISHPFTGLQLLAIVGMWSVFEMLVLRSRVVPVWFPAACFALVVAHVGYYLVFLNSFPEHRVLQAQWTLPLLLPFSTFVFANVLVGMFAVWRMRSLERAKDVLREWPNRLLFVWFVVTSVLVNHDLFMKPVQPVHFNRGYLWIPLFLLGLPVIMTFFSRVARLRPRAVSALATAGAVAVLVFDNAAWLAIRSGQALGVGARHFALAREPGSVVTPLAQSTLGFGLTKDQLKVLDIMNDPQNRGFVVVSADSLLGYLATVYSPLRSWRSHHANTPQSLRRQSELNQFFDSSRVDPAWNRLPVLFVFQRNQPWRERLPLLGPNTQVVMIDSDYVVVRRPIQVVGQQIPVTTP